jgi:hypothetical protein
MQTGGVAKINISRRRSPPTRNATTLLSILIFTDLSSAHPDFESLSLASFCRLSSIADWLFHPENRVERFKHSLLDEYGCIFG